MKRVWTEARAIASPEGWGVQLDGKPLRLPDGPALLVPQHGLAEAVAAEWQAAGQATGVMDYTDVPLTRLAGTAQLRIVPDTSAVVTAIAAYGETDLICYWADTPPALVERQETAWRPWLDWSRREVGAVLTVTTGIIHVKQHPAALAALRRAVAAESGWVLAGLGIAVPALGSLVLGLALARGEITPANAHATARVDELFQIEQWGTDDAAELRQGQVATDIADAARFMELVR
jgi:chaperone required for assembly of F1-ATPase